MTLTFPRIAPDVSPQPIVDAAYGFATTRVVASAVELEVFTFIEDGYRTILSLSEKTGCSTRGLAMILNALVALEYLEVAGGQYKLRPVAGYLDKKNPHYLGGYLLFNTAASWETWAQLPEVVRTGQPARRTVHGDDADSEFFASFVGSLYSLNAPAARAAAEALASPVAHTPRMVLDVGAGSAVWSLACAMQDPQASITAIDMPGVIDAVTRPFTEREGLSYRYTFWKGSVWEMELGEESFDVVLIGHLCHGESPERIQMLLDRSFRALRPGGQILIAEFLPDDERGGPLLPLLFAIQMMVLTDEGNTYTLSEYRRWLRETGFADIRTLGAPAPSPLILATKSNR